MGRWLQLLHCLACLFRPKPPSCGTQASAPRSSDENGLKTRLLKRDHVQIVGRVFQTGGIVMTKICTSKPIKESLLVPGPLCIGTPEQTPWDKPDGLQYVLPTQQRIPRGLAARTAAIPLSLCKKTQVVGDSQHRAGQFPRWQVLYRWSPGRAPMKCFL